MRVLHLTAELWPYARTGGLGQAVAGIAAYQAAAGIDTNILLPLYREAREHVGDLEPVGAPFTVELGGVRERLGCWRLRGTDPPYRLFLEHAPSFDRAGIYGDGGRDYPDNHRRFALFALGAIEVAGLLGAKDLILHAHDWHAGLVPVYLRHAQRQLRRLRAVPSVVTVHNGGFQGVFPPETLGELGLPPNLWAPEFMEWFGRLNYLKGGLVFADMVTTVSPTHAVELCTDVGGFGLQDVFRRLGDRLVGIRNGIDMHQWDPQTDPEIASHFGPDDLSGKAACKAALQQVWNLPQRERVPVFAMSARLVSQKGMDLIIGSECVREMDAQFVVLGEGEPRYEVALRDIARQHPSRVALNTAFADELEHRLLAGADFLLMPSLYEPCGLTQMRAQRYGALPLARRVGGLADTISDGKTGILFDDYTPAGLDGAVRRAVAMYQDPVAFQELERRAMRQDFSWSEPGAAYSEVYRRAFTGRAARRPPGSTPGSDGASEAARSRFRTPRDTDVSPADLHAIQ